MGEVIGELLPLGLGVAISPLPIIEVILMLLAPHAGTAFSACAIGRLPGCLMEAHHEHEPHHEPHGRVTVQHATVSAVVPLLIDTIPTATGGLS